MIPFDNIFFFGFVFIGTVSMIVTIGSVAEPLETVFNEESLYLSFTFIIIDLNIIGLFIVLFWFVLINSANFVESKFLKKFINNIFVSVVTFKSLIVFEVWKTEVILRVDIFTFCVNETISIIAAFWLFVKWIIMSAKWKYDRTDEVIDVS